MKLCNVKTLVTASLLCLYSLAQAVDNKNPPPPDEAMKVTFQVVNDEMVRVQFDLIQDVYLYKNAFGFTGEDVLVDQQLLTLPKGKEKNDPAFGLVEVYYGSVGVDVPVTAAGVAPKLTVKYQGCVENFICYPPQRKIFDLSSQLANTQQQAANDFSGDLLGDQLGGGSFFGGDALLPVDQAFQFETIALSDSRLMARFTMAPNIYLYQDQIQLTSFTDGLQLGEPVFPQAQRKDDPEFGLVDVYYDIVEIEIPYSRSQADIKKLDIEAAFQGCEDGKVCYPPTSQLVSVDLPVAEFIVETFDSTDKSSIKPQSETDDLKDDIASDPVWLTMLNFFGFGLLLSLTPCVFPMIPILSGLIVGQKNPSTTKAFSLSLIYVLAMALTYTLVG
ncbi:MAG: hypothetical protein KDI92_05260, partial [Xanthomonadales bacterium]|nr:hypothetical protein [Xanthomonadales bacterium]